eukprot:GHVU01178816.1.p2 GENE.GHVU01178816.1~~GHVU01178816.1.p2  ORF type:complete len:101 (+),score=13.53 GHVU01178816.1:1667-1969(+)
MNEFQQRMASRRQQVDETAAVTEGMGKKQLLPNSAFKLDEDPKRESVSERVIASVCQSMMQQRRRDRHFDSPLVPGVHTPVPAPISPGPYALVIVSSRPS